MSRQCPAASTTSTRPLPSAELHSAPLSTAAAAHRSYRQSNMRRSTSSRAGGDVAIDPFTPIKVGCLLGPTVHERLQCMHMAHTISKSRCVRLAYAIVHPATPRECCSVAVQVTGCKMRSMGCVYLPCVIMLHAAGHRRAGCEPHPKALGGHCHLSSPAAGKVPCRAGLWPGQRVQ